MIINRLFTGLEDIWNNYELINFKFEQKLKQIKTIN